MSGLNFLFAGSDLATGEKIAELLDALDNADDGTLWAIWNGLSELLDDKTENPFGIDDEEDGSDYAARGAILEILRGIIETKLPLLAEREGAAE